MATREPPAFLLQQQKLWSWENPNNVADWDILIDHFKANQDNLFFKPPMGTVLTEVKVPLLLAVSPHIFRIRRIIPSPIVCCKQRKRSNGGGGSRAL
jgi:hypothetical protein